jgi:hypothetical protein
MLSIEREPGMRRRKARLVSSSMEASMANLYFEELQIGSHSAAGPYLLSKDEIIRFAKQYDQIPRHIESKPRAALGSGHADPGLTTAHPNLKTAAVLGLTLPNDVLATANV